MLIGAQMYTVRDFTRTLDDFANTLERIADIGYKTVQVSGTCAYDGKWLAQQLDKNGLKCVITHYSADAIKNDTAAVAALHDEFGCRCVGLGCIPGGLAGGMDDYNSFVAEFKPAAAELSRLGHYFMYHNHDLEFAKSDDGRIYLERMAEDFTPEEMGFTLDTFWVQAGGGDPAQWIRRLAGRVPCVHFKDLTFNNGKRMAVIGEGNMNFDSIIAAATDAGVQYALVEQDDCYGEDPFDCLKRSYQNLKSRGLA